jgi:hypothetical protein
LASDVSVINGIEKRVDRDSPSFIDDTSDLSMPSEESDIMIITPFHHTSNITPL